MSRHGRFGNDTRGRNVRPRHPVRKLRQSYDEIHESTVVARARNGDGATMRGRAGSFNETRMLEWQERCRMVQACYVPGVRTYETYLHTSSRARSASLYTDERRDDVSARGLPAPRDRRRVVYNYGRYPARIHTFTCTRARAYTK